jgi:hypothetical protein
LRARVRNFRAMTLRRIVEIGAVAQLARVTLRRRSRFLQRHKRRNRSLGILALGAGVLATCTALALSLSRREQAPQWPSKKKARKQARRANAARRAVKPLTARPPVHVETNASTDLKVPLKDLSR